MKGLIGKKVGELEDNGVPPEEIKELIAAEFGLS